LTSQNKPNPDLSPVENTDIDKLLNQVDEMTNRMENLMANNRPSGKKTPQNNTSDNPAPPLATDNVADLQTPEETLSPPTSETLEETELEQAKDIKHLDELTSDKANKIDDKWDMQELDFKAAGISEPTGHELDDPASPQEIHIDEHVDSLAEDEINQMLNRLGKGPADASEPSSTDEQTQPAVIFPTPIRKLLSALYIINYPFIWIPASVRDCLGYIAIGTLLFALGLWVVACIFY
jgi:hypothetical protein